MKETISLIFLMATFICATSYIIISNVRNGKKYKTSIEKAKNERRVATANLIKRKLKKEYSKDVHNDDRMRVCNLYYRNTYQYSVNGKTHKFHQDFFEGSGPDWIEVYHYPNGKRIVRKKIKPIIACFLLLSPLLLTAICYNLLTYLGM